MPAAFCARFPVLVKTKKSDQKTCRPAINEAPRRTREKTCGTRGNSSGNKTKEMYYSLLISFDLFSWASVPSLNVDWSNQPCSQGPLLLIAPLRKNEREEPGNEVCNLRGSVTCPNARWSILRENSACYCLHLASNLVVNAASSNSKVVSSVVSLCNVVFSGRSKMSGSGSTLTKPVPEVWQ